MTKAVSTVAALLTILHVSTAEAQDLDALLAKAMQGRNVPAMSVLVIRHGHIDGEAATGRRSVDAPDSVTTTDVWHIGSDGKAMTAAMIACLVDRHVLSWETPLALLLPELASTMQPAYRRVTLRDLLSHQAGLQANIDITALDAFRKDRRSLHEQRVAYAQLALAQPPAYEARTGNVYSNSGPVIAATVAEQATGLSYEQLMQREVFTPLQMTSAAFGPTHNGEVLGHGQGKPQTGPDADNAPVIAPVGEIHLAMNDWAKFAIDQLRGEHGQGKLLQKDTYRVLHTPGHVGSSFALGWIVSSSIAGETGPFLSHAGSNTYWYAVIVLAPASESGILVAANSGEDSGAAKAEGELVRELLPTLQERRRARVKRDRRAP